MKTRENKNKSPKTFLEEETVKNQKEYKKSLGWFSKWLWRFKTVTSRKKELWLDTFLFYLYD